MFKSAVLTSRLRQDSFNEVISWTPCHCNRFQQWRHAYMALGVIFQLCYMDQDFNFVAWLAQLRTARNVTDVALINTLSRGTGLKVDCKDAYDEIRKR